METIKLEIEVPTVDAFSEQAAMLSILMNRKEEIEVKQWIASQFINLYTVEDEFSIEKYVITPIKDFKGGLIANCPFIQTEVFDRKTIDTYENGIIGLIYENLKRGTYLYLMLNKYYLPCADQFQKQHFNHATLIYGINPETELVSVADNYRNNKYSFESISFDSLIKAFNGFDEASNQDAPPGYLLRWVPSYPKFDTELVRKHLSNYISIDNFRNYSGIGVYDLIQRCLNEENLLHVGSFHALYEHKKMMLYRLEVMTELGWLPDNKEIFKDVTKIVKDTDQLRFTYLKFIYSNGNENLRNLLKSKCEELKQKDQVITMWILDSLHYQEDDQF